MLYSNLSAQYGKHAVPAMPPKQLLKNESPEFLLRRQQQLAAFIAGIVSDKVLSMSAELCAFLEAEAGSQLRSVNTKLIASNGALTAELAASEQAAKTQATAAAAQAERDADELAVLRQTLSALTAENNALNLARDRAAEERDAALSERDTYKHERDAAFKYAKVAKGEADEAKVERDEAVLERDVARIDAAAAKTGAKDARDRVLAMLCRGRNERLVAHAVQRWLAHAAQAREGAAREAGKQQQQDVAAALTNALSAAISAATGKGQQGTARAAAPAAAASTGDTAANVAPVVTDAATDAAAEGEETTASALPHTPRAMPDADGQLDEPAQTTDLTPTEHSVKYCSPPHSASAPPVQRYRVASTRVAG